jgi:arginyl-tRNA synthetase
MSHGTAQAEHVAFRTVNGKDGKPFKTREGGVMRLQSLLSMAVEEAGKRMEEGEIAKDLAPEERSTIARKVGYAAVKFSDLSNHRSSDYSLIWRSSLSLRARPGLTCSTPRSA